MDASQSNIFALLKEAAARLALASRLEKDSALQAVARALDSAREEILAANRIDVKAARNAGVKEALVDRLALDGARMDSIIEGVEQIVRLPDPTGIVRSGWTLPNGLFIQEITAPLGVAAIIYESRPNVTADAFAIAYKAGCAILLRGSSAALNSNRAITAAIKTGLESGGGIANAVALAGSGRREEINEILNARGFIDVVIPRGGRELIRYVVENARVPVIETGEGNCHIYVAPDADMEAAARIIENAKLQKPGACNAVETLLVHSGALDRLMPLVGARLAGKAELRCDARAMACLKNSFPVDAPRLTEGSNAASAATGSAAAAGNTAAGSAANAANESLQLKEAQAEDWETEFLDFVLAIKTVDSLEEAISHINRYGTRHSEAILTENIKDAGQFFKQVDAACIYTNASTRWTDGGEFGFGAELGISTQKFHVRGPMGLSALTTIKYRIDGQGQIR
jgi:glutamate-5-semialdehyde dehydrogenase